MAIHNVYPDLDDAAMVDNSSPDSFSQPPAIGNDWNGLPTCIMVAAATGCSVSTLAHSDPQIGLESCHPTLVIVSGHFVHLLPTKCVLQHAFAVRNLPLKHPSTQQ